MWILSNALALPLGVYTFLVVGINTSNILFPYFGDVIAVGPSGDARRLSKRSQVEPGDTIKTESNSMVQIRMIDKAFVSLRSNSEVKIESYQLGATKEEDVGLFDLIKGGLRAITGIIGNRLPSAYRMRTPDRDHRYSGHGF